MSLDKKYEIIKDSPKTVDWEVYSSKIQKEYFELLCNEKNTEKTFQKFFEENPSFIPGAFELFGCSGHYPFMGSLISQPDIGNVFHRKPDFMWLAQDSLTFTPIFIEIESPNKKMFTKNKTTTAEFNQALGQILEWKYILNQPTNNQMFYDFFNIPLYIRKKTFKPQFLLVYGRRAEFEGDDILTGNRAAHKTNEIDIMSFDRLSADYECRQMICCKVVHGKYNVINISPTYKYMPGFAEWLVDMNGFKDKIKIMKYVTEDRKKFLIERYQYWINYGKQSDKGIICGQDCE